MAVGNIAFAYGFHRINHASQAARIASAVPAAVFEDELLEDRGVGIIH